MDALSPAELSCESCCGNRLNGGGVALEGLKLRLGIGGAAVFAGLFGVLWLPAAITWRMGDPTGGDCVEIGVLGPDDT